jgi:transcriptional regulator with GAF, ATPase, and Fis domain
LGLRTGLAQTIAAVREPIGRRHLLIITAAILVCVYALGVFWYVLSIPDIGLRCAFTPVVNRAYPSFIFSRPGEPVPQLVGTVVEQIGSHPVESWPRILYVLVNFRDEPTTDLADAAALDDPALTHVRFDGAELVRVRFRQPERGESVALWFRLDYSPLEALLPSILWFFLKIGLFVVAALVFWKRPMDRSAGQFFLLSILTFGAFMGGYHWWRIVTQPVLLVLFATCSVLLPAATLHFYLLFPRPKALLFQHPRWTLSLVYGVPIGFLVLVVTGYLRIRWLFRGESPADGIAAALGFLSEGAYSQLSAAETVPGALALLLSQIYVYLAIAASLYLGSIACLIHSAWTARDVAERNQVKCILLGSVLAAVPMGYSLYLAFLAPSDFGGGGATWPMFAASFIMTVAYTVSITRYRLLQLDQLINWSMAYFLISFLAGLAFYGVVFAGTLFSQWIVRPSLTQALGVSTAALVFLLLLNWLRGRVKRALDRRFHREKYQLDRTLRRMSQAINRLVDPPTLGRTLLQAATELFSASRGAVYLRDGDAPLYRLAETVGPAPALNELASGCPLIEALETRGSVAARSRLARGADHAQRQLQFLGAELAQPLIHEGQMLALLVLGPKELGHYGAEDLNALAAFAQVTALALASARGQQIMEGLNRDLQAKVAKIAEQQRRILALQNQLTDRADSPPLPTIGESGPAEGSSAGPAASEAALTAGIVATSPQAQQLLHLVKKVSASQSAVLIRGESGTGKELLARALHEHSPRAGKAFVKVHCAALSPGLLESELFGHVKGAYTGAHRDKVGRFELAHGGTLFLDEIGDISLDVQTKLLRVLQEMTFERVGSSESLHVDVRIIAATHRDLEQLIKAGRFREDLYYRLNVISIPVLPLRERREDIPELALHFLKLYAQRSGKPVTQIEDDAMSVLKAYTWPGNIRQLENAIERSVVITEGPIITVLELPPEVLEGVEEPSVLTVVHSRQEPALGLRADGIRAERADRNRQERERLVRALALAHGNKAEAARTLGMARSTLVSRLKKHGLS